MGKTISFNRYYQKTNEATQERRRVMYEKLIKELHDRKTGSKDFSIKYAENISKRILEEGKFEKGKPTPIIKIAENMGFKVFQQILPQFLSGFIGIGEMMREKFGYDKVICVNISDELGHQRFVIGHELGHYLFDYDGSSSEYYDTYLKNNHTEFNEKRANKFSASLLMPFDDFREEMNKIQKENEDDAVSILKERFEVQSKAANKRMVEVALNAKIWWWQKNYRKLYNK